MINYRFNKSLLYLNYNTHDIAYFALFNILIQYSNYQSNITNRLRLKTVETNFGGQPITYYRKPYILGTSSFKRQGKL